jgi:cytochrome c
MRRAATPVVALVALAAALGACEAERSPRTFTQGSTELGMKAISRYGCGSCHLIPGVKGADAQVGPPLEHFSKRLFIAGRLANTEENLARWIQDPQGVEPGTAMPNLGVSAEDARNIAAYLISLE